MTLADGSKCRAASLEVPSLEEPWPSPSPSPNPDPNPDPNAGAANRGPSPREMLTTNLLLPHF